MPDRKPPVLVVAKIPADLREALGARYDLVDYDPGLQQAKPGFPVALTTSVAGASRELMDLLPDLKLVACQGVGLDKIDVGEAEARGILVRHTPGIVTDDTADMAVALVYAASRRIVQADAFVRAGRWPKERIASSRRVVGKRAGVVGLGRIGSNIAERLAGAGLSVAYTGPRRKPDVAYPFHESVRELAAASDILVLSCPGDASTRHIVDAEVLKALGPDGTLVNVSRGSVVDEEALIAALQAGTIAGAGLDVFEHEPAIDPRFFDLDNVVLQPHAATITKETRAAMIALLGGAIAAFYGN